MLVWSKNNLLTFYKAKKKLIVIISSIVIFVFIIFAKNTNSHIMIGAFFVIFICVLLPVAFVIFLLAWIFNFEQINWYIPIIVALLMSTFSTFYLVKEDERRMIDKLNNRR